MRYFLIAGEASGDLHASNLMIALKKEDPAAQFGFLGGDLMHAVGGMRNRHYGKMSVMGVIPVLLNFRTIMRGLEACCSDIRVLLPDAVILIDFPGFNLTMAKYIKTHLPYIRVYYYISPKIWAWKKYRIRSIKRYVDQMYCILPFEVDFYKELNYEVDYVGNPSVDSVSNFRRSEAQEPGDFRKTNGLTDKPILAILPGSRKAEIRQNLPTMLAVAKRFPDVQPVIAVAPGLTLDDYTKALGKHRDIPILFGQTYPILAAASYAMVNSGTATLETALFRVPQVVCYYFAGGKLVNFIFKHFFHAPYISLVNLIAKSEVVKELFGANFSFRKVHDELSRIINDEAYRSRMLEGYDRVIEAIGYPGASERAAEMILFSFFDRNLLRSVNYHKPSAFNDDKLRASQ